MDLDEKEKERKNEETKPVYTAKKQLA